MIEKRWATSQLDSDAIPIGPVGKFRNASVWTGEIAISQASTRDGVNL